ncbi:hypothetical protein [Xylocopilactobacillus apicola]|uniref:Uncharacterized protein n=1 Tax=Xylocopilactobacillus apicola TaxID=2932184 RepID=A0AAU9D237_9LACO|nr:hypothetical protein [Xylocopilactobacillus apicola]BDR57774.1 hypothetical protein XA3_02150 [Xylocopilactobacillus apicola]
MNDLIEKLFPINNLGIVASLISTIIVTITFWLIDTVKGNPWDQAVILKKVVNFKLFLIGLICLVLPFLLWAIPFFRILSLIVFGGGLIILSVIIFRSVRWLSDWSESYPNGVRYSWRIKTLLDKSLDDKQRLQIWEKYLDLFSQQNKYHYEDTYNGNQFLDFFKTIYAQGSSNLKLYFLTLTKEYLNDLFLSNRIKESDFLIFGFNELFKLIKSSDDIELYYTWLSIIRKECNNVSNNDFRSHEFLKAIYSITPNSLTAENNPIFDELANNLCNLLWFRDREGQDYNLINKQWRIDSESLFEPNKNGISQSYLISAFLNKVNEVESKNSEDRLSLGLKLDYLFINITSNADPINFGILSKLFNIKYHPPFDTDWSEYLFEELSCPLTFGYIERSIIGKSGSNEEFEKYYISQKNIQELESMKVAIKSLPILKNRPLSQKYISKLEKTFESNEFQKLILTDNRISNSYISRYKESIKDVKKELSKIDN